MYYFCITTNVLQGALTAEDFNYKHYYQYYFYLNKFLPLN